MKELEFTDSLTKEIVDSGYVLAIPTETVYGLGIRWDSSIAYDRLCNAKNRRPSKPIAVMCGDKIDLNEWFDITIGIKRVIDKFLPGPLTILLKANKKVPFQAHLGTGVVGLRIPAKKELLDFLNGLSYPLQVTSANISGQPSISDYELVKQVFVLNHDVQGIVKGTCVSSIPTTVIDLTGEKPVLVRQGEIKLEDVEKVFLGE